MRTKGAGLREGGTSETRGAERPPPPAAIIEEPERRRRRPEGPGRAAMTSASTKVRDLGQFWADLGIFGAFFFLRNVMRGGAGVGNGGGGTSGSVPLPVLSREGSGWGNGCYGRFRGLRGLLVPVWGSMGFYWSQFGSQFGLPVPPQSLPV